jgi:hypothetical protein
MRQQRDRLTDWRRRNDSWERWRFLRELALVAGFCACAAFYLLGVL